MQQNKQKKTKHKGSWNNPPKLFIKELYLKKLWRLAGLYTHIHTHTVSLENPTSKSQEKTLWKK